MALLEPILDSLLYLDIHFFFFDVWFTELAERSSTQRDSLTKSGEKISGEKISGQQVSGEKISGQQISNTHLENADSVPFCMST